MLRAWHIALLMKMSTITPVDHCEGVERWTGCVVWRESRGVADKDDYCQLILGGGVCVCVCVCRCSSICVLIFSRLRPRLLMQSSLEDIPRSHDLHSGSHDLHSGSYDFHCGSHDSHMTQEIAGSRTEKRTIPFLPNVFNPICKYHTPIPRVYT